MVDQYLRHNLSYKKYKLFDVTNFILVLLSLRQQFQGYIQQSLSRTRSGMESLHSALKLLSNAT